MLYGLEHSGISNEIEIVVDYPSNLPNLMQQGGVHLALLPVAAIPTIPGARIVSNYGIASDGNVVSVALFSRVPIEEIKSVYLDYQSRTSVRLAQLLLAHFWKKDVVYLTAGEHYIDQISGTNAGVIIGDRALKNLGNVEFVYDLSAAWKAFTGLDFIFAAWVANKELSADFLNRFDKANALGLRHLDIIIAQNPFPYYDLLTYYTENIKFELDSFKLEGLNKFLGLL